MSLPAQPLDFNPIELMWDELDRNVRANNQLLKESWIDISLNYVQSLEERMLIICEQVIAAKGSPFDKSKV